MRIGTWNVNGVRARYSEVVRWAADERLDAFCLQEIKASSAQVPEPLTGLPAYHNYWHGSPGGYSGVSVHVLRGGVAPVFSAPPFDIATRAAVAELPDVVLASIYVPNGNRDYAGKLAFLEGMATWIGELAAGGRSVVVCGDLNVARFESDVHERHRDPDVVGQTARERELFERLFHAGLIDLGVTLAPASGPEFTWWAPWRDEKAKDRGWRIDYVAVTPDIADRARSFRVLRSVGTSDHAPLVVELESA
jgi:exodeoxyribonuclease-3